jgi:intracellular sulfur oxidation DsrE/DsrF family protein
MESSMRRRNILAATLASAGALFSAARAQAAAPDATKVVYHLDDLDKVACLNTMRAQEVALKDLLPGFIVADKGGVVRIAELQSQGYLYLRP